MRSDIAESMDEARPLVGNRAKDLRPSMADGGDAKAGGQIDKEIAIDIKDVTSEGLFPNEGRLSPDDRRLTGSEVAIEFDA